MKFPLIFTLFATQSLAKIVTDPEPEAKVTVQKCCDLDSILVEVSFGIRQCQKRRNLRRVDLQVSSAKWEPSFYSSTTFKEVLGPRSFLTQIGLPECESHENMFSVYVHDLRTDDSLRLLSNGSLSHHLEHGNETAQPRIFYPPGKYCVDDMLILSNASLQMAHDIEDTENEVVQFATICVNTQVSFCSKKGENYSNFISNFCFC